MNTVNYVSLFSGAGGLDIGLERAGFRSVSLCEIEAGYSCRAELLNSADYGSFQRRVRCFIIGTKNGKSPLFPAPTHQKQGGLFSATWKSLGAFLENHADQNREEFTFPTETLALQLHGLLNGTGLKSKGKAEKTRPGGHWGYRQGTFIADLSLPARTVTGSACQDWIRWDGLLRRLTLNEVKLLQGFPYDWEICGTRAQKYTQIGNAVPTLFGELIGKAILKFLCEYPDSSPAFIEMPHTFRGYIDYTKKDHARNADTRTVHRRFGKG